MAKVTLRIVGLFFNESFDMTLKKSTTVKDVVDEFRRRNPGRLSYVEESVRPSPKSFTCKLNGIYNFDGLNTPTTDPGTSLGGKPVRTGEFTLAEAKFDTYVLAWQYYVVSKGGKVKSKTPPSRGFTFWNATPPDYRIVKDDTIIWRLVAIAKATEYHNS
jgi:hypothetical protein